MSTYSSASLRALNRLWGRELEQQFLLNFPGLLHRKKYGATWSCIPLSPLRRSALLASSVCESPKTTRMSSRPSYVMAILDKLVQLKQITRRRDSHTNSWLSKEAIKCPESQKKNGTPLPTYKDRTGSDRLQNCMWSH